jgi:hypothetical protein
MEVFDVPADGLLLWTGPRVSGTVTV